jgi:probable selenium-dependent hydroxylase accessory protein YqeC
MATRELIDLLGARRGVVCFVGAGGKKSALYHLAARHPGRVGISSTVHIPYFPPGQGLFEIVEPEADLYRALTGVDAVHRRVAFATPSSKPGRWAGVSPELLERVHRTLDFDALLVKADGARARLLKAPMPGEPLLPPVVTSVALLVSAAVVGLPATDACVHRPGRLSELSGLGPGGVIEARHLAAVMVNQSRELAGVPGRLVTPVVNMVDDRAREKIAQEVAEQVLSEVAGLQRVVLTRMTHADPVVAVIER